MKTLPLLLLFVETAINTKHTNICIVMDNDISSLYTERRWGKEEGGENVTDGFVFRGKKAFGKVLKCLKEPGEGFS